jgi:carboxypeptidase C (cathepsin A)
MKIFGMTLLTALLVTVPLTAQQKKADPSEQGDKKVVVEGKPVESVLPSSAGPDDSSTDHVLTEGGQTIAYTAVAGTVTVGSTDQYDAMLGMDGKLLPYSGMNPPDAAKPEDAPATARMFYTAYFKKGVAPHTRPVMFLYNGGPGSSTMWLHMGSFGPRRIVTPDTEHQEAAPYSIVDNPDSLLDVTDLVFIDAPGTGFSRIMGKDHVKAFWGTDPDAHAFDRFIRRFLTKYDRWNSPKYLFGESYGTPRSAVLSADLQNVDLNGIVLLSAILNFDNSIDGPMWNPGIDQPYIVALPTYAATAFFHHKLPQQPADLEAFLKEVETFALGDYASALVQGSELPADKKQVIAEKLHSYTGLPTDYLLKADLRVSGGQFSKELLDPNGMVTGRLDSRFQGPAMNPMSETSDYDPQSQAISSAYTTAINQYLRQELKYGRNQTYKPGAYGDADFAWDIRHQAPGGPPIGQSSSGTNVMPDLADSMKANPKMHILLAGGYFDLATPFYEGIYEMHHLPIPQNLQKNISYHYFQSGHMVYVNQQVLHEFHNTLADFIHQTEVGK